MLIDTSIWHFAFVKPQNITSPSFLHCSLSKAMATALRAALIL